MVIHRKKYKIEPTEMSPLKRIMKTQEHSANVEARRHVRIEDIISGKITTMFLSCSTYGQTNNL